MEGLAAKAVALIAASRKAISAAMMTLATMSSKAVASAKRALQIGRTSLASRTRVFSGHAAQLPRQSLALIAASAALVFSLAILALTSDNGRQGPASVELALLDGSGQAGADGSSVGLVVDPPTQALPQVAKAAPQEPPVADGAAAPEASPKQSKEPNLAGLAEIPKDLLTRQPKHEEDDVRRKPSFAAPASGGENLPWDAVEPVTFTPMGPGQQHAPGSPAPAAASASAVEISDAEIGKWLKGKATTIKGADRERPLYHFVVWVEPPEALQAHVAGVSYDFSSPAVQPQSQASSDRGSNFQINAAGLACADEITVTLRFDDGRVEKTNIDGCKLFDKA